MMKYRNGGNDKSPLIGQYCGSSILPNIRSFSNQLYLRFRTDSTNERKGENDFNVFIIFCIHFSFHQFCVFFIFYFVEKVLKLNSTH